MLAHDRAGRPKPAGQDLLDRDRIDVLLPENEAPSGSPRALDQSGQRVERKIAGEDDIGRERFDPVREAAADLDFVVTPANETVFGERTPERDRIDCECVGIGVQGNEASLGRLEFRKIEMERVVAAARELSTELYLE